MKRLPSNQIELIDAWIAESAISEITPALLEKDIHVTDALSLRQHAIFAATARRSSGLVFPLGGLLSASGKALQPGVTVALTTITPPQFADSTSKS